MLSQKYLTHTHSRITTRANYVEQELTAFREMSKTIEMVPLSPADCLLLATSVIGEALIAAHPNVDLLPPGSDMVLHEKSGGGNPLFVRNIAIVSKIAWC